MLMAENNVPLLIYSELSMAALHTSVTQQSCCENVVCFVPLLLCSTPLHPTMTSANAGATTAVLLAPCHGLVQGGDGHGHLPQT